MTSVDDWVKWSRSKGLKDSHEYLGGVDAWRQAWRPKRVRVLLVAESHVAEEKGDLRVRVRSPEGLFEKLPRSYVRLVYCLAYGEDCLCEPKPKRNPGTWQFWKIFQAISDCSADAKQPRKGQIMPKVEVLRKLQSKGVWLVDASVAALYSLSEGRLRVTRYHETIRQSFEEFVWPMMKEDPVKQVWIIGRGVGNALTGLKLKGMPDRITRRWIISQPQDRTPGRFQEDLKRLVRRICVCKKQI